MADPSGSTKAHNRSKHGCLTCRSKRVKCDEALPVCKRCVRLNLKCEQPFSRVLPSLGERRRGFGPLKSRSANSWSPSSLQPTSLPSLFGRPPSSDHLGQDTDDLHGEMDEDWSTSYPSPVTDTSMISETLQALDTSSIMSLNEDWILSYPQDSLFMSRISENEFQPSYLPRDAHTGKIQIQGMPLSEIEKEALSYFRTSFSLSQTTRDPQWSTTTLLLKHSVESSNMLLHLILAVSLYDLHSSSSSSIQENKVAQKHYETGATYLAEALQATNYSDHISVLGSLYCVYAYMSRQSFICSSKIDRLSFTTAQYIKQRALDVLFLVPNPISTATQPSGVDAARAERSLVARLIMWLIKIDAQCCFLGCTPSLLEHFVAQPQLLICIQATSRLALQLNWGKQYPISQSIRDIESNLSMDMMADLLMMSYRVSRIGKYLTAAEPSHQNMNTAHAFNSQLTDIKRDFDRLEVKYGAVFYYGSSEMTLQPAMKLNCAASATMFYATKIYLLRISNLFGAEPLPEAIHAQAQLLLFAKHVCNGGEPQPVYEFQWSLFIACLETSDSIHQEWLQSRICDPRFRTVLGRVLEMKRSTGGEIGLEAVRRILHGTT